MSCVLDLYQICPKRLCVFFSHLFWLVLCFFCILSSSFFEANDFLYYVFFASINCFIWSSHIFKYFLLFRFFSFPKLSCAADFRMFYKCSHSFSTSVSLVLYCLNEASLFVCTAILCFHCLAVLFWRIILDLYWYFLFSCSGEKFIFAHNKWGTRWRSG